MLVNDEKYVHNLSVLNIKEKLTNWAAMRQGTLHIFINFAIAFSNYYKSTQNYVIFLHFLWKELEKNLS